MTSVDVLVRFPKELADALKAEKARTHEPTSSFIRRAVIAALNPKPRTFAEQQWADFQAAKLPNVVLVAEQQQYEPDFNMENGAALNASAELTSPKFKEFMDVLRSKRDAKVEQVAE